MSHVASNSISIVISCYRISICSWAAQHVKMSPSYRTVEVRMSCGCWDTIDSATKYFFSSTFVLKVAIISVLV